ncbi:MAG TPA: adenylyltransferase/cytidyltransferase family protein [Opitutaceae bacterium]|jgi:rfaE bifunctional protein nucleotidyltransferase chain/domain|nr:adenylyltransferase/cytidyltransferase family protein [Opitutaceae bacterium]
MKLTTPKLMSLRQAAAVRKKLRRAGGKLVLTNGVFDLLHPGHTSYLAAVRRLAGRKGKLFVVLNSDRSVKALKGKFRPILDERSRAYNLGQLASVDGVIIFRRKRLDREIAALQPDIYCKAGDYTLDKLDPGERAALEKAGARIKFLPFLPGFSTTNLIARIKAAGEI